MSDTTRLAVVPADMTKLSMPIDTVFEMQGLTSTLKQLIELQLQEWGLTGEQPRTLLYYMKLYQSTLKDLHKMTEGVQLAKTFKKADIVLKMFEMQGDIPSDLKQRLVEHLEQGT